jgi:hypothetical protein
VSPEELDSSDGKDGRRRHFSAEYKRQVLQQLDGCTEHGARTALLERERLLWSHVAKWRRQRDIGALADSWVELSPLARLQQLMHERNALLDELDMLRAENSKLRRESGLALLPPSLRAGLSRLLGRQGEPEDQEGEKS